MELTSFDLPGFQPDWRGKVRDIYIPPDHHYNYLAIVTTDRISAGDVIVGEIPGLGIIRNKFSIFWKRRLEDILPNDLHPQTDDLLTFQHFMPCALEPKKFQGRTSIVRHLKVMPIEFIVRFYVAGSLQNEYFANGCEPGYYFDNFLPGNLRAAEQLPYPIFTPTTKAPAGKHDRAINRDEMINIISKWILNDPLLKNAGHSAGKISTQVIIAAIGIFIRMHSLFLARGIRLADLKLEFGLSISSNDKNKIFLVDEISPDSFRAWPDQTYQLGRPQISWDKDLVRRFTQTHPGMPLSPEVIEKTYNAYKEIYDLLVPN